MRTAAETMTKGTVIAAKTSLSKCPNQVIPPTRATRARAGSIRHGANTEVGHGGRRPGGDADRDRQDEIDNERANRNEGPAVPECLTHRCRSSPASRVTAQQLTVIDNDQGDDTHHPAGNGHVSALKPPGQDRQIFLPTRLPGAPERHATGITPDTKPGVTLAFVGATTTVLFKDEDHWTCLLLGAVAVYAAALFASVVCAWVALFPGVKGRPSTGDEPDEDAASLLFFGHVSSHYSKDRPSYLQVQSTLTTDPAR